MKRLLLFSAILFAGCATTQMSNLAVETGESSHNRGIKLTYEIKQEFSTEYFGLVAFAIQNPTNSWVQVDSVVLEPSKEDADNMDVTGEDDLNTWFQSMNNEKLVESYNKQMLWGTLSLGAAVGGALSNNEHVKEGAEAFRAFSHDMMTLERFNTIRNQINLSSYFPEDHLLRTPFRVPPGLTVHKWMVINSQVKSNNQLLRALKMVLFVRDNGEKEYDLRFLDSPANYNGNWQHDAAHRMYGYASTRRQY